MTQPLTLDSLRQLLVKCGGIPESMTLDDPAISLADLGLDSAVLLGLQFEIEQTFAITLLPDDLLHFETLGGGIDLVDSKLAPR